MFNESKYQKCIGHLVGIKVSIIIIWTLIFLAAGLGIGYAVSFQTGDDVSMAIGAVIGAVIGLIVGFSSTWRIEMRIQESYWRIDMLRELKNNTANCKKASAVVAPKAPTPVAATTTVKTAPEQAEKEVADTSKNK